MKAFIRRIKRVAPTYAENEVLAYYDSVMNIPPDEKQKALPLNHATVIMLTIF